VAQNKPAKRKKVAKPLPNPGDSDEAVYGWTVEEVKQFMLHPRDQPPWVRKFPYGEYVRKHYVGVLRLNEEALSREAVGYDEVRQVARTKIVVAAKCEEREKKFFRSALMVNGLLRVSGSFLAAVLLPWILFHQQWDSFDAILAAGFAVTTLNAFTWLSVKRRFGVHYAASFADIDEFTSKRQAIIMVLASTSLFAITLIPRVSDHSIVNALIHDAAAILSAALWGVFATFLSNSLAPVRRKPDPRTTLPLSFLSIFDFVVGARAESQSARMNLILELENVARNLKEASRVREYGVLPAGMDFDTRIWLREWQAGLSAKIRSYKRRVIHGGKVNMDSLAKDVARDFVTACNEDWSSLADPIPLNRSIFSWKKLAGRLVVSSSLASLALVVLPKILEQGLVNQLRGTLLLTAAFALFSPLEKSADRAFDAAKSAIQGKSEK
jgi:hypothetical protein